MLIQKLVRHDSIIATRRLVLEFCNRIGGKADTTDIAKTSFMTDISLRVAESQVCSLPCQKIANQQTDLPRQPLKSWYCFPQSIFEFKLNSFVLRNAGKSRQALLEQGRTNAPPSKCIIACRSLSETDTSHIGERV
jgi:hypothetical protein